jgi:hypothetical protein
VAEITGQSPAARRQLAASLIRDFKRPCPVEGGEQIARFYPGIVGIAPNVAILERMVNSQPWPGGPAGRRGELGRGGRGRGCGVEKP